MLFLKRIRQPHTRNGEPCSAPHTSSEYKMGSGWIRSFLGDTTVILAVYSSKRHTTRQAAERWNGAVRAQHPARTPLVIILVGVRNASYLKRRQATPRARLGAHAHVPVARISLFVSVVRMAKAYRHDRPNWKQGRRDPAQPPHLSPCLKCIQLQKIYGHTHSD